MSAEVTIVCDGCAHILTAAKTAKAARQELRGMGGRSSGLGFDFCPRCIELGRDNPLRMRPLRQSTCPAPVRSADRSGGLGPDQWTEQTNG